MSGVTGVRLDDSSFFTAFQYGNAFTHALTAAQKQEAKNAVAQAILDVYEKTGGAESTTYCAQKNARATQNLWNATKRSGACTDPFATGTKDEKKNAWGITNPFAADAKTGFMTAVTKTETTSSVAALVKADVQAKLNDATWQQADEMLYTLGFRRQSRREQLSNAITNQGGEEDETYFMW